MPFLPRTHQNFLSLLPLSLSTAHTYTFLQIGLKCSIQSTQLKKQLMEKQRKLEVTLISGKGLQKVNLITKMDVYAVAEISGGPKGTKQKTQVDKNGDANPSWNFPMKFTLDDSALHQNRLTLVVKLKAEGMLGNKEIGEVHIPVKELADGAVGKDAPIKFVSYQVRKPNGKPKGELYFSYKFGDGVEKAKDSGKKGDQQPVTAYTMQGPSSGYPPPPETAFPYGGGPYPLPQAAGGYYPPPPAGYPPPPTQVSGYPYQQPPPQAFGYAYQQPQPYGGYPPPAGYPYPPQQGYGYPPQQQVQQPKKNKFGMGLGAGLLGGALGGLLIGDIVSDGGGCGGF